MIDHRDATPEDGPALDTMARAIWVETFGHSAPPDDIAAYLATAYGAGGKLLGDLADCAFAFRVAVSNGDIVGYAKLGMPFVDPALLFPGALQLHQLYVASSHHGGGIAQALMAWTIETARTRGAPALMLTVWEENMRAQRFYDRYGFVHVGDYPFQTGQQIDRDLILRLTL